MAIALETEPMKDRRRSTRWRIPPRTAMLYLTRDGGAMVIEGRAIDVSTSGIRFEAACSLDAGDGVLIELIDRGDEHRVLAARGNVIRLHGTAEFGPMQFAVGFRDWIDPTDPRDLDARMRKLLELTGGDDGPRVA